MLNAITRNELAWLVALVLLGPAPLVSQGAERVAAVSERVEVDYPPAERRLGHEGTVTVAVEVRPDGTVGSTRVVDSSRWPQLDEAALQGVRDWKYSPAIDAEGHPVVSVIQVRVEFPPERPHVPGTEAGRLGEIWIAYQRYRVFNEAVFARCGALGIDTTDARQANAGFDAGLDEKFQRLDSRLKEVLLAGGAADSEVRTVHETLLADLRLRMAELFDRTPAAELRDRCLGTLKKLGSVEGSFRFDDTYERLMTF